MNDDQRALLKALEALDPSKCTYSEWVQVGMALKAEGLTCSDWDDWSRRDPDRYESGGCESKWKTFSDTGKTNGGTIFYLAERYDNYKPFKELDWDDGLDAYYEEVLTIEEKEEHPWEMTKRFLETLYKPDETISYVHSAKFNEKREKWVPADGGHVRKVSDVIKDLKKHKNLEDAFGTFNEDAGGWIRVNPTTGPNDKDVTRYSYVLAESDDLSIDDQKKLFINFKLPIATLVESGGKSVHALVKVDAENDVEYDQRVAFLFDWLAKHKFIVDKNNANPARLCRLAGVMRKGKLQRLIATNIGCSSWLEWKDYIEGIDDDLPQTVSLLDQLENPPALSPELISGVLREGCKMIITGESKAGKTCLSQNLAVCIAEGLPWLDKFKCARGKVLYINLEVEAASLSLRFRSIYKAMGIEPTREGAGNIVQWNLRGHAAPMPTLAPKIIRRCRNNGPYKAIILDPLYKVQQGDENSAEAIIKFTNALDNIAHETGAAVIYDHHHPKGATGDRKAIDRGAGSGVFSRDADAICDLSFLSPSKELKELIGSQMGDGEKPMQIELILRDFKDVEPIPIWFKFPLHFVDSAGLLDGVPVEGSREANLQLSSKRTSETDRQETLRQGFLACEENGLAKLSEMVDFFGGSPTEKTLRRYIKESDEFEVEKGYVKRKEE